MLPHRRRQPFKASQSDASPILPLFFKYMDYWGGVTFGNPSGVILLPGRRFVRGIPFLRRAFPGDAHYPTSSRSISVVERGQSSERATRITVHSYTSGCSTDRLGFYGVEEQAPVLLRTPQ